MVLEKFTQETLKEPDKKVEGRVVQDKLNFSYVF